MTLIEDEWLCQGVYIVGKKITGSYFCGAVVLSVSGESVADILGHEDISQTFKYAHLSPAHLAGAMQALDKELTSM